PISTCFPIMALEWISDMVPIPFNFCEAKIGAIPTTIYVKKFKVGMAELYHKPVVRGTGNGKGWGTCGVYGIVSFWSGGR
ncbi:MAG: hypothetical protein NTY16_07015, partial [Deltaproteobacteria bacterium]|nr:hypothetical protein [Deltaproteobacteria bacterium]